MTEINYFSEESRLASDFETEAPVRTYGHVTVREDSCAGRFSFFNNRVTLHAGSRVGQFCSVGKSVEIGAYEHPLDRLSTSPVSYNLAVHFPEHRDILPQKLPDRPLRTLVGHDVWIGTNAILRRGITVGHGAVIAAGAFVTKDVAPYEIVGGLPAKHIRWRFPPETIAALLELSWWDLPMQDLATVPFDDIDAAIARLREIRGIAPAPKKTSPAKRDTKKDKTAPAGDGSAANPTIADLRALVNAVPASGAKPLDEGRLAFLALLRGKLMDHNAPDSLTSLLEENASRLYVGYNLANPAELAVLNTKIDHVAQLAEQDENDGKILSRDTARTILEIMRRAD